MINMDCTEVVAGVNQLQFGAKLQQDSRVQTTTKRNPVTLRLGQLLKL